MTLVFDPFTPLVPQLNGATAVTAPADVTVGENDLVLTMDLPGVTTEDLAIELADGYLSVRGERRRPPSAIPCVRHAASSSRPSCR